MVLWAARSAVLHSGAVTRVAGPEAAVPGDGPPDGDPAADGGTATATPRHRRPPARAWAGTGRALAPLWRPVAVLVAARLAMQIGIFIFSHVFRHFTLNPWDGGWYVLAAQKGWPHHVLAGTGAPAQDTLAFFPAFPTLIRVVHFVLPLTWNRAGEGAALLCEIAMVCGVWLLARELWGRRAADRAVVVLCFFPGAFILAMMYSEPMLIALAAFCFLALRRGWWVVAGVLAAMGAATRIIGVALIVCCAWEALRVIRADRRWGALWAVAISPLALIGWFAYLWASTGDRMAWLDTERNGWAQHTTVMAIPDLVRSVLHTHPADPNQFLALASTVLGVVLLAALVWARPPSMLTVYSVAVLVLSATSVNPAGIRFRFVLTAFPLVIVVGRGLRDAAFAVAVAMSSLAMGIILCVTLMGPALIP